MAIYTGIIYCYTNTITNKQYIGQTIHPEQRKRNHLHEATVRNSDYYFHRSIRKHGWENFVYEVLEENIEQANLNDREQHYIEKHNTIWPNGYNQCPVNSLNETAIEKMKATKKKQFENMTEEEKREYTRRMWENNIGKKRSEETRRKQSESAKKYLAENPRPPRKWTQEMKDNMSKLLKEKYKKGIGRWAKKRGEI